MTIYLVIIEDRHVDLEILPFARLADALREARGVRDTYLEQRRGDGLPAPERVPCPKIEGWHFNASLSDEGDSVCVRSAELELP